MNSSLNVVEGRFRLKFPLMMSLTLKFSLNESSITIIQCLMIKLRKGFMTSETFSLYNKFSVQTILLCL